MPVVHVELLFLHEAPFKDACSEYTRENSGIEGRRVFFSVDFQHDVRPRRFHQFASGVDQNRVGQRFAVHDPRFAKRSVEMLSSRCFVREEGIVRREPSGSRSNAIGSGKRGNRIAFDFSRTVRAAEYSDLPTAVRSISAQT